jgi:hypothetical protein
LKMSGFKLKYGLVAEYNSAIDQANLNIPQTGLEPLRTTYLCPHERILAPQNIRDNDDINKLSHRHKGKGNRPGRRGALKCARCRRQKRGSKVGTLFNFEPDLLGSL